MNWFSWPDGLAPSGSLENNHHKNHSFGGAILGSQGAGVGTPEECEGLEGASQAIA
jgi:hypothetical protein